MSVSPKNHHLSSDKNHSLTAQDKNWLRQITIQHHSSLSLSAALSYSHSPNPDSIIDKLKIRNSNLSNYQYPTETKKMKKMLQCTHNIHKNIKQPHNFFHQWPPEMSSVFVMIKFRIHRHIHENEHWNHILSILRDSKKLRKKCIIFRL